MTKFASDWLKIKNDKTVINKFMKTPSLLVSYLKRNYDARKSL